MALQPPWETLSSSAAVWAECCFAHAAVLGYAEASESPLGKVTPPAKTAMRVNKVAGMEEAGWDIRELSMQSDGLLKFPAELEAFVSSVLVNA